MTDIEIVFNDGLHLPALDLWLDAHVPRARAFVSHSHADHIESQGHLIATSETARILRHRLQASAGEATIVPYSESIDLPGEVPARLTLYPGGHCLGSAQALIEVGDTRICYTGDMKLRPNVAAETAVIVPCDILIIECTFGEPRYVFPPDDEIQRGLCSEIEEAYAVGEVPVVLGYAL